MKTPLLAGCLLFGASFLITPDVRSQGVGLEGVIVEEYYTSNAADAQEVFGIPGPVAGSKTYRIYVDLAPGWNLQQVAGYIENPLQFSTTTGFYNATGAGTQFGDLFSPFTFGLGAVPLDSYLSFGFAGPGYAGVAKADDTDGSIYTDRLQGTLNPINVADGLAPTDGEQSAVSILGNDNLDFVSTNGASSFFNDNFVYFDLNSSNGILPANKVLIAQLTTTGELSFKINLVINDGTGIGTITEYYTHTEVMDFDGPSIVRPDLSYPPVVTCNVDGGTVSTSSNLSGICAGDDIANQIVLTVTGNVGVGRFGLVSLPSQDVIAQNSSGIFNLNNFPAGNYALGYVSVESLQQLSGVNNVNDLEGCFDLANFINVNTNPVNGGVLTANGPTTVCNESLSFSVTGQVGNTFRFALLNLAGTEVFQQNSTGVFNFSALPNATYRVVHVASRGVNLGTIVPPFLPECVEASNQILVVKSCPASLTSSPNPTSGNSFAEFSVAEEQMTTLEVYDMSGRKVAELFRQVAQANAEYRVAFDGANLPNGVYVYRLTTSNEVIIDKFMIAK